MGFWSSYVFTSDDAVALTNSGKLPFVVTLNCFNGFFYDTYSEGLAETLLKNPNGGSIGGLSSVESMTSPDQQTIVAIELNKQLFNGLTVGDAMIKAKAGDQRPRRPPHLDPLRRSDFEVEVID